MIKKFVLFILSMVMSHVMVIGQVWYDKESKSPEEWAKTKASQLANKLTLSNDQQDMVYGVLLESAVMRKEIGEKYPQVAEAKAEMKAHKEELNFKMFEVLTPSQQQKMKEIKKERVQEQEGVGIHSDRGQLLERMRVDLDLSEDQFLKIQELHEQSQLFRNQILSKYPELKLARKEWKKNRDETRKQIKKILTPEQVQQFDDNQSKSRIPVHK